MDSTIVKMHVFLDACNEVENTCAEMYYLFAQQFTADRKASRLWGKTAMEEEDHARHVLLAKKMVKSINWVCVESWQNVASALNMVKQFIRSVRESPPSLEKALLMALQCEYRMEILHMQSAILMKEKTGNSMFKSMIKSMIKEDRGHIEMLEAALYELQKNNDGEFDIIELDEPVLPTEMREIQQLHGKR